MMMLLGEVVENNYLLLGENGVLDLLLKKLGIRPAKPRINSLREYGYTIVKLFLPYSGTRAVDNILWETGIL